MEPRFVLVLVIVNLLCISALGQASESPFGNATSDSTSLKGDIYYLQEGTSSLPDFSTLTPVGSIYTKVLDIPTRSFTTGFPGVTNRFEWFAIRYTGTFNADRDGDYAFRLVSDDGSRLFIDGKKVIDNDGTHATQSVSGNVHLARGQHSIEVDYFQGPREEIALQLFWTPPGGSEGIANPQFAPSTSTTSEPGMSSQIASITDFKWQGTNEDKVGEWDSGSPDGRNDGHFLLTLSLPGQIEIKSITIYSADANGTHVGGQVWDTASASYWILGVFYQGSELDQHHVPSLGSFSGNVQFDLYGDDSGWFKPGNWFEVEVLLGDGTKLTSLVSINSSQSLNADLTGVWSCDDGGTYYIRQLGNIIWWYGEPSDSPGQWSNVAKGTISGNTINLDWADVPKGSTMNNGILVLTIVSNDKLTATQQTGGFGGSTWTRRTSGTTPSTTQPSSSSSSSGPSTTSSSSSTNPWEDPAVRQLIDEWLQQQDKCVKTIYPGAYIDKWGRICGDTGTATISCSLTPDHPADWDSYHYLWYNNWCPDYYPYRVQDYVKLRQSGSSFNDLAECKGENEVCY